MEEFGETEKPRTGIVSPGEALPSVPVPGDKASGDFALTCLQSATLRPVPLSAGRMSRIAGRLARAVNFEAVTKLHAASNTPQAGQDALHAKACPGCGQSGRRFSRHDCRRFVRGAAPNRPMSAGFGDSSDLPREHSSVRVCDWIGAFVRPGGWRYLGKD